MASLHQGVTDSSNDSSHPVCSETACSTDDNLLACSSTDVMSPITVVPLEETDSRYLLVTTENTQNGNDHNHNREDCTSTESDEGSTKVYPVNPHLDICFESEEGFMKDRPVNPHTDNSFDEKMSSSTLHHDAASPNDVSLTAAECLLDVIPSVDSEARSCAPIVAVGGAREEELKRGLEQRLGLVLSKLARETEEDVDDAEDQLLGDSIRIVSDHFSEDEDSIDWTDTCTTEASIILCAQHYILHVDRAA